jgi:hypothetical protein
MADISFAQLGAGGPLAWVGSNGSTQSLWEVPDSRHGVLVVTVVGPPPGVGPEATVLWVDMALIDAARQAKRSARRATAAKRAATRAAKRAAAAGANVVSLDEWRRLRRWG